MTLQFTQNGYHNNVSQTSFLRAFYNLQKTGKKLRIRTNQSKWIHGKPGRKRQSHGTQTRDIQCT